MLDAARMAELEQIHTGPFHDRNAQPCHSIGGWACVYTHAQAERWARDNLDRAGYETYLPLYAAQRRDRVVRSMFHKVELCLFPRYLFIRFDGRTSSWSPIRASPGVADVVRNGTEIAYAPERAVEALRALDDVRRTLPTDPTPQWAPGTVCGLGNGPLAGHPAVVLSVSGARARVAVMFAGGLRVLRVSASGLVARD